MKLEGENELLRIFVDSAKRDRGTPIYERLVLAARATGCRGATVLRAVLGFERGGRLLHATALPLAEHAPMIVEIVDEPSRIDALLEAVAPLLPGLLVTRERALVIRYRQREAGAAPPALPPRTETEASIMAIPSEGMLLRIFIGDSDRWQGKPLYEEIVRWARELGLAGATVLKGPMGFGAHSRIHTAKILRLSEDLPVVIEIVDGEEPIRKLLAVIDDRIQEGLVTLEKVRILKYAHRGDAPSVRP
jgi:PII-like signaling protein